MPIVVSPELLALLKDFGNIYHMAKRSYSAREFFFKSPVLDPQKVFGGSDNVERFSVMSTDRVR